MSKIKYFSDTFLDKARQEGDKSADEVVKTILQSPDPKVFYQTLSQLSTNKDLLSQNYPKAIQDYLQAKGHLPAWSNKALLRKGSVFFQKYSEEILSSLGFLSLPYCYAGADGAKVLYQSERIGYDTRRRLAETGQFVLDVMQEDAFESSGKGFVSILKVRLLHASVRWHILRSGQWDLAWGFPINQEDMAGTNGAFSWIALRGLKKIGYSLDQKSVEGFLHLWQVIGYLMGVKNELLPEAAKENFWLDKQIAKRQFKPSKEGQFLTKALLKTFETSDVQKFPKGFVESYMRFLLGEEVADILGIPQSNWTKSFIQVLKLSNQWQSFFGQADKPKPLFREQIAVELKNEGNLFGIRKAFT